MGSPVTLKDCGLYKKQPAYLLPPYCELHWEGGVFPVLKSKVPHVKELSSAISMHCCCVGTANASGQFCSGEILKNIGSKFIGSIGGGGGDGGRRG